MKSRVLTACAGIVLALGLAGTAEAQIRLDRPAGGGGGGSTGGGGGGGGTPQQMIDSLSPNAAAQILQAAGYKSPQMLNLQGNMKGIKMDLNGTPVVVVLADCKGEACSSYAFLISFGKQQVSAEFLNKFNSNNRYARIYTADDGDVLMQMDGQVYGGVGPGNFAVAGAVFGNALKTLLSN